MHLAILTLRFHLEGCASLKEKRQGCDPMGYCEDEDETECGCGAGKDDIQAGQRCTLAGTEHCDFVCHFARDVREKLREMEDEKHE